MAEPDRHIKLPLANTGYYIQNEWVLHGLTCDEIEKLYREICQENLHLRIGYLDALHGDDHTKNRLIISEKGEESIFISSLKDDSIKSLCEGLNGLLINGNHHIGSKQILVLNEKKRSSIAKRKLEITNPVLLVEYDHGVIPQDFLSGIISEETRLNLPICRDLDELKKHLLSQITAPSKLKVLILAGGKSERMGSDKTIINYHSIPQWQYVAQLVDELHLELFISCRDDQVDMYNKYSTIVDRIVGIGPMGAILSAFMNDPNAAWMVLATDMPNLNSLAIMELLSHRDCTKIATAYIHENTNFAEPLFAVYEPSAYRLMLDQLSSGRTCPRKFLNRETVHKILIENEDLFLNVNTPEERDLWMKSKGF